MKRVLTNVEFNAYARERTFQVVVGGLHVFRTDVNRMRIEIGQNLRYGFIHERIDVDVIDILVVDDVQEVVEPVASRVDNIKSVAREMIGIECSHDNTDCHAQRHKQGHVAIFSILIHCSSGLRYKTSIFAFLSRLMPSSNRYFSP